MTTGDAVIRRPHRQRPARSAVTVAHRLLKNTIRERIGFRPHLFMIGAAPTALGLSQVGLVHGDEYPDAGRIQGRIVSWLSCPH